MTQQKPAVLTVFLVFVLVAMGSVTILKGGLYVGKHEGDTLHLMQIVFRIADGQTPHLDFMTPIGALAFWPIAMLVKAGMGVGMAIIWSQVLVAALFLPVLVWVAQTRLTPMVGALFGLVVMVLLLALVHGEAQRAVSISMHYNRLAWAAAFVAIVMAVLPPRERRSGIDGIIIGAMVCIMVLIKMTYFVSFAVPIVLALVLTGQVRTMVVAVVTGLAIAAGVTVFAGVDYWFAYAGDLLAVAGSEVRAAPGEPLTAIMGAPAYLGGSMVAVAAVIALRQAGVAVGGLVLLLLLPGFFYVTFQNFGNDPQWLLLLAVLLLAFRETAADTVNGFGWNMRNAIGILAGMAMALTAPSFFNLAYSPFRHMRLDTATYAPILPRGGIHSDLQSANLRVNRVDLRVALDGEIDALPVYEDRDAKPVLMGETFDTCSVELGLPRVMDVIAQDMEQAGLTTGKSVFAADLFSSYWLFTDLDPMEGGAPWYYGGVPGLKDADYVLVPICPVAQDVQAQIFEVLEGLLETGKIELQEIRRTDLYVLFEKTEAA